MPANDANPRRWKLQSEIRIRERDTTDMRNLPEPLGVFAFIRVIPGGSPHEVRWPYAAFRPNAGSTLIMAVAMKEGMVAMQTHAKKFT